MKRTVLMAAAVAGAALIYGSDIAMAANIAKMSPGDTSPVQQVRRGGGGHFHGGGFRGPRFYGGGYVVYPYYYDYGPRCWWSRRYHRWVCPYYY
jgi:hypothetical protein